MERRGFLKALGMLAGGIALEQAIPFGRVWSFPSKIVIPESLVLPENAFLHTEWITAESLRILKEKLVFVEHFNRDIPAHWQHTRTGSILKIRLPRPWNLAVQNPRSPN